MLRSSALYHDGPFAKNYSRHEAKPRLLRFAGGYRRLAYLTYITEVFVMCFAAAPFIMMGLSAAMSAVSASSSANAQNRQADHNAEVARNNAAIARQEGDYAKAQALRNANEKRAETAVLIGAQRARQGASGVTVNSGSAADVTGETAWRGEREAMAILQQGDTTSWRTENQAREYEGQSRLTENSKVSVKAAVAGSVISSLASSSSQFIKTA